MTSYTTEIAVLAEFLYFVLIGIDYLPTLFGLLFVVDMFIHLVMYAIWHIRPHSLFAGPSLSLAL